MTSLPAHTPEAPAGSAPPRREGPGATTGRPDDVPPAPALTISGSPTPEEVAAVVAVLSALSGGDGTEPSPPPSRWASPRTALRSPVGPGPGAWRASARP